MIEHGCAMTNPSRNLLAAGLIFCALLGAATIAQAGTALDCQPPIPPAPVSDPAIRKAYGPEIRSDFLAYFDEAQTHLRCLESARAAVTDEVNQAIADYQAFGPPPAD